MIKKRTTKSFLLTLLAGGSFLAADARSPKIVVGIVVDQLRTDYLEQLRPYFGSNGFNRLMDNAVFIPDVDFRNAVSDAPSGAAVIYTGAWPVVNGVASTEVYDASMRRSFPTLSDHTKTRIEYTPEALRVSTLGDEFVIQNGTLAKNYSVAGDAQVAMVSAGHNGNAAVWFDEYSGKWNTPAYYGSLPASVANKNRISPASTKMASTPWRPKPAVANIEGASAWSGADFSYSFSGGGKDGFSRFKASAPFNSEVTDIAIDLLKTMTSSGGMLNLGYSLAPYPYDFDGDNRPEIFDAYIRLDADIGRLLDSLDKDYGKGNALVFIAPTGYALEPAVPEGNSRVPSGEITLKQAESLLNSYLSASYGNGDYVVRIHDGHLYLDSKLAGQKGLDIKNLRKEAKDFLLRMGGIREVLTVDEVLLSDSPAARELAVGVDPKGAPDLFLRFAPGWTVTDDSVYPAVSKTVRLSSPATPAFILAPDLEAQTLTTAVDASAIAPTIASLMRIRAPNAAGSKPLVLKKSKD